MDKKNAQLLLKLQRFAILGADVRPLEQLIDVWTRQDLSVQLGPHRERQGVVAV
jgi:hypothetical protein